MHSYYTAKGQVLQNIQLTQSDLTTQVIHQTDYIAENAIDFTNYLFLLNDIQSFLNPPELDSWSRRQQVNEIASKMMIINQNSMHSLLLYSLDERVSPLAINQTYRLNNVIPFQEFKQTSHYQKAAQMNGAPSWTFINETDELFLKEQTNTIILTRMLKSFYTMEDIGLVSMGVDVGNIFTDQLMNNGQLFLFNEDHQIMAASDEKWIGSEINEIPYFYYTNGQGIELSSEEWIMSQSSSGLTGWHAVIIQPQDLLLEDLSHIKWMILLVVSLSFIVFFISSWYVTSVITSPLLKLKRSMLKSQEGDFSQSVQVKGNDEIGIVGKVYNDMLKTTKKLINDVYRSRLKQKEAELNFLQSQISPHFLYNTLDTIFWSALKKGQKDLADMIYALSNIFRSNLNDGKEYNLLEKEMTFIENYLILQKLSKSFDYEIHLDDTLRQMRIPKLILQPIVENAIVHGLKTLKDQGLLQVKAFRENNKITIQITDNGVGIPSLKLKKMQQRIDEISRDEETLFENDVGYALSNIAARLKLKYGSGIASITIDSTEGVGTRVIIQIPKETEDIPVE